MIIGLLCWVILGCGVYAFAAPHIRERKAQKGMMDHVYTIRGHLLPSYSFSKAVSYNSYAGCGFSSSGELTHFYQPHTGKVSAGFVACIGNAEGEVVHARQLPNSNQADPFFTVPRDKRDGTMRYVTDKNGDHYFISFVPDEA